MSAAEQPDPDRRGRWKTTTVVALTLRGMIAPFVLSGPINREAFEAYVAQALEPDVHVGVGRLLTPLDAGRLARAVAVPVTPHVLKHTAVTWAFQRGMSIGDAADWFATLPATLLKHYREHSLHYQNRARAIMERR